MEKDNKEFDALEALDRQIHEREEKIMKDLLESKKGRERLPVGRMEPLPYEETNTLINNPNNKRDDLVAEVTEGMNGAGAYIPGLTFGIMGVTILSDMVIKGDANLLDKGVATEAQMKKYLGNNFDKKKYKEDSDYREEKNYYYYIEKNSLNDINPKDIEFNKNGTITVKNKEGKKITLSEEKSYKATLYHQKIYIKGEFKGIKSRINPELNRKFKNNEGYELVLSADMNKVIKDQHNTGTFNWDSDNNLEHFATDVEFYKKYGSGINDETTRKEREKTGEFIKKYWEELLKDELRENKYKLKEYIKVNKINAVTPKVLEEYETAKTKSMQERNEKSTYGR